jgi:hypothetical protein
MKENNMDGSKKEKIESERERRTDESRWIDGRRIELYVEREAEK